MSTGLVMGSGPQRDQPADGLPARPSWMAPRGAKKSPPPAKSALAVIDPTTSALPDQPRTWGEHLRRVVFRAEFGWGWVISGLLHLALLASLGLLVYHRKATAPVEINAVFGVAGDETILDSGVDADAGGSLAPLEFEAPGSTTLVDPAGSGGVAARVFGDVDGIIGGDGLGDGGSGSGGLGSVAGNVRVPASAITKGSFTVWTEPEDPLPRRPYEIVIQVQLSSAIKGYRLRDLTGIVTGTDNFEKPIKFKSTERRAVKDGKVQVRIPIPGADKLVRDTIRVRSDILKEEQTIEIVF